MLSQEVIEKVDRVCKEFSGNANDLYSIIGIVVVGQRYGWRVVRLTIDRRLWVKASKYFGDLKQWMPERGDLAYKSMGLSIVDSVGNFWEVVKHQVSMPMSSRRKIM